VGTCPQWRDFHTATAIGSKMYIFGGRSDHLGQFHSNKEVYHDQLKYLDLTDGTWYQPTINQRSDQRPSGRRSHSAWEYNGCLYVFGGFNGNDSRHFNDLIKYDPVESKWYRLKPLGSGPKPRRRQCCVVNGSKLFLFGGTSPLIESPVLNLNDPLWPERNLVDHSDLYVLDMTPSLKTLAMTKVISDSRLHTQLDSLPTDLKWEIMAVTHPNKISGPRADSSG